MMSFACKKSLRNIIFASLFVASISIGLCLSPVDFVSAQDPVTSIHDVKASPQKFLEKKITVRGKLLSAGKNYFTYPSFVIEDQSGEAIAVNPWLPLEIPPSMPGRVQTNRPRIMSNMLGKRFLITGTVRHDEVKKEYFLDVETADEDPGQ